MVTFVSLNNISRSGSIIMHGFSRAGLIFQAMLMYNLIRTLTENLHVSSSLQNRCCLVTYGYCGITLHASLVMGFLGKDAKILCNKICLRICG
jgi:hypothetical protein